MATTTTATATMTVSPSLPQGASSKPSISSHDAFPPPTNFKTIDGLLKSHAAEADQKPLICYPASGVDDFEEHTAAELDRYTDSAVRFYIQNGLTPADSSLEKAPVISLLAPSSFEVILTIFALNRLGYAILFLSTRLTAPAYARLMGMADSHTIIHSPSFTQTTMKIDQDRPGTTSLPILRREDWHNKSIESGEKLVHDSEWHTQQGSKIAWILHSSGSTGFPKPIFLTNMQCLANFRKSFGLRAFTASPLFHSGGLMEVGRAFYARATMYLANHSLPVTSSKMLKAIGAAKPKLVIAVPYVLQLLAEKSDGVKALADADVVLFNGSGCPDDLGDRLVEAGVNLAANYGATETGQLMTSYRGIPPTDKEWSYLRLWKPVAEHTLMDEIAPGVFEAVGLDGLPSKGSINTKPPFSETNPENAFRTADLFTRHPDPNKSNYYKYLSRLDDRITLVMGEKVLPLPMEGRIRQEDIVREAVVFGFQRALPGILIFRPDDQVLEMSDEEYLQAVWPAVEAANAKAETFSRIIKDLVIIKGPKADYPKTDKGTFIRAQVYQQYDADIKAAYTKLDTAALNTKKLELSIPELEDWLLARFRNDLHIPIEDTVSDIFAAGVDSLQTTRIWRTIKQNIDLGTSGDNMSTNVVFECGTISRLAKYLYALRTGEATATDQDENEIMQELIEKYSSFPQHSAPDAQLQQPEKQTVLLTGATGNLGAFILADLLNRPSVSKVIVLNRASDDKASMQRTLDSLSSRQIPLSEQSREKLQALACDLSSSDLGLEPQTLHSLQEKVSHVIHSAWAVNFNLGVRSFEAQHIKGTYNLIKLCLSSNLARPAKFFFCSSVSTASGTPKPATIREQIVSDLGHSMKTGYGRSKMVAEHVTVNAMKSTGMHARVLRVGQLCGDTRAGIWNDTEAIALMIRSALATGALPALDEQPSWLPVDVCARAVSELTLAASEPQAEDPETAHQTNGTKPDGKTDPELVYHVLNPQTFSFRNALLPKLQHLAQAGRYTPFEIVSPQTWLQKLSKTDPDPMRNPSIKLLDFWKGKYGNFSDVRPVDDDEGAAGLTFVTERTVRDCGVLGEVKDPVSEGLIEKYVDSWMRKWKAETT